MANLIRAGQEGAIPGEVVIVIAPRPGIPSEQIARDLGVAVTVISPKQPAYEAALLAALREARVDLVCLAGYMTKLPVEVLQAFPGAVLNVHPALLPRFGGKGMYGMHVHEAVLASGERESGATVHIVTENYDEGPIVVQLRCDVQPGDDAATLAQRVLALEHQAYREAIRIVVEQRS